ncbi:MAG: Bax inhibitor-1/YccA family protein [Clostridia bacterium]|jgi:FtsH-binding integral membrane protein|nr:Bax inhibitor-1/YccA family protein [Clostridia bacterium]
MEVTISSVMNKVYMWMFAALFSTGAVAAYVSNAGTVTNAGLIVSVIVQFIIIFSMRGSRMESMNTTVTISLFFIYAALNGYILSILLAMYEIGMITYAFGVTALVFGVMALVGTTTKKDLSSVGHLAFIGLLTVVLISFVGIFISLPINDLFLSYAIVIIFLGLIAYETQKIKQLMITYAGTEKETNIAIYGAFGLYIDFVNLFIHILKIFASRRD